MKEDLEGLKLLLNDSTVPEEVRDWYKKYSASLLRSDNTHHYSENAGEDISLEIDEPQLSYHEYMDQLSEMEVDLLYTAYYDDFKLFNYDVWE